MLKIRALNGPEAGKIYELKDGLHTFGRAQECDIILKRPGISKRHAEAIVEDGKLELRDLNSSNGTLVNGVRIKKATLGPLERFGLDDLLFEILPTQELRSEVDLINPGPRGSLHPSENELTDGMLENPFARNHMKGFVQFTKDYIEKVVLPGVYSLAEWVEFRWVVALFLLAFVFSVTFLSAVPLVRILRTSIEVESQSKARVIARHLAQVNQDPMARGLETAVSVHSYDGQGGVDAFIIDERGFVLAPARKIGQQLENPFVVQTIRGEEAAVSAESEGKIVALVPIQFDRGDTGTRTTKGWAVVIYHAGSLAVNDERTLSLLIQTFFIALILGSILFFFLYHLIEHPIRDLKKQLDSALNRERRQVDVTYDFPALIRLADNINTVLSRMSDDDEMKKPQGHTYDRTGEMQNLVNLVGFPAVIIGAQSRTIDAVNSGFSERVGLAESHLQNAHIVQIPDQALKLSLMDLVDRSERTPQELVNNQIEFGGYPHEIVAQAVFGQESIAYFLIVILPVAEGAAA